ncbi:hypothetical protein GTO27_13405 [Candidatus Bathyarchaeota archaeon]|nr:hypothetical protein [Candidatus Bathyarchaeota archaeon]
MIAYYDNQAKAFSGDVDSDMAKVVLNYYHGLIDTDKDLRKENLIIKVERTPFKEDECTIADDYTMTTYQQIAKTEFTITRGEKECPEETTPKTQ